MPNQSPCLHAGGTGAFAERVRDGDAPSRRANAEAAADLVGCLWGSSRGAMRAPSPAHLTLHIEKAADVHSARHVLSERMGANERNSQA